MNEKREKPKKEKARPASVVFHSYPKLIFAWPLIVMGFVFYFIAFPKTADLATDPDKVVEAVQQVEQEAAEAPDAGAAADQISATAQEAAAPKGHVHSGRLEVLGWVYLILAVLVVLTIGVDIERNVGVFWAIAILFLYFLGKWLGDAKGLPVFEHMYDFFADMQVQYNRGFGLAVSCLLLVPYGVIVFWARIQNKWRITHNEFEHYSFGRADDSLARGAKRVRSTYPDLLELLLLGSGTLIVYSATGRSELRRIPNVPLLPLMRRRINAILEQTAVTMSNDAALVDEASDAEAVERSGADGPGNSADGGGREPL